MTDALIEKIELLSNIWWGNSLIAVVDYGASCIYWRETNVVWESSGEGGVSINQGNFDDVI